MQAYAGSDSTSPYGVAVRLPDVVSRALVAFGVAGLAIYARSWALDGELADEEALLAVPIAAIVGLSAFLAWMPAPLLVRAACHLATLWIARETLGQSWHAATSFGVFLAGSAAFFGTLAVGALDVRGEGEPGAESPRAFRWSTGEMLALLFVAGAYGAIARQELDDFGPATLRVLQVAILHGLVPFAALGVGTRLAGRLGGSLAICVSAVAVALAFPVAAPCDPTAIATIVALSALADRSGSLRRTGSTSAAAEDGTRTEVDRTVATSAA